MQKKCLIISLCFFCSSCFAFTWNDLWYNKFHQGVKSYRSKNYQGAVNQFSKYNNAEAHYNRGNALAFSKKYKEAIEAYDQALKLNPKMADATYNREIIKKLLKKQKENKNKKKNQQQKSQQSEKKQKSQQKQKNEQQAQNQQQQVKQSQKQQKQQKAKQKSTQQLTQRQHEKNQSEKQLLNRIPDDPGGLLRRKFKRDYEQRIMEANRW